MVVQQKFAQNMSAKHSIAPPATFSRKYRFRLQRPGLATLGVRRVRLTRKMNHLIGTQTSSSSSGLMQGRRQESSVRPSRYKPLAMKRLPAHRRRCTNFPMIKGARRC